VSIASSVASAISGNGAIAALLTGGSYEYGATGRSGLSRNSVPAAFDSGGVMKPCAIVRNRSGNPFGGVYDRPSKTQSLRDVVEVYVYADGDELYSTAVEPAADAIELLLNGEYVSGAGWLKLVNRLKDERDPELNNAIFNRIDFQVIHLRSAS